MLKAAVKSNKGVTLLEILVAVFVIAIVAMPLLTMFSNNVLLLRKGYEKTDATYDAKAMMENLYPLGYTELFEKGKSGAVQFDDIISKKDYTLQLSPSGPTGAVPSTDTPCFMHLFISASGTGKFMGTDGMLVDGSLADINPASIQLTADKASKNYTLKSGTTEVIGTKPEGATPVLIVVNRSGENVIHITANGATVLVYSPVGTKTSNITVDGELSYQLYINDNPPATMLVMAVLKTYTDSTATTPDSVFQDILTVGTLP